MDEKISKNLDGVAITDELNDQFGSGIRTLKHDTFFGATEFTVRTAPGGGGTLLTQNTHYVLENQNARLTSEAGKPVYISWRVTDSNYQNINLYVTYWTIGDFAEAADINELINLINTHTHDYSGVYAALNHNHDTRYFTETELGATEDGAAGADRIGATPVSGIDGETVQEQIESVVELVNGKSGLMNNMLGVWPFLQSKLKNITIDGGAAGSTPNIGICYYNNFVYTISNYRNILKFNARTFTLETTITPSTPTSGSFLDIACDGLNFYVLHVNSSLIYVYKYDLNFNHIAHTGNMPTDSGGTIEMLDSATMCLTPDYVFLAGRSSGNQQSFCRIPKSTMTAPTYSTALAADEYGVGGMAFDGNYIYFGHVSSPAKFTKWNMSGTKQGSTLTLASGDNCCEDLIFIALPGQAPVLMAALYSSPSKICVINPATMTQTGTTLTFAAGENNCRALIFDGLYVLAACDTSPVKLLKFNITPAKVHNTLALAAGVSGICGMTFDGTYVWGRTNTNPLKVFVKDTLSAFT
jgi:hypothetical protein